MAGLPKKERKSKTQWFGSAVSEATAGSPNLPSYPFPETLLAAMKPHLDKATTRRHEALMAIRRATSESIYDTKMTEFLNSPLSKEGTLDFDTQRYPLRQALQASMGLPPN